MDTRSQILQAAGEVFAERGFADATVREICQRAGVNIASINYHFGDKRRLYIETIKHAHCLREKQFPFPEWPLETSPEEKLRKFIRVFVKRLLESDEAPWQHRLIEREIMEPTGACEEMVQDSFKPVFGQLCEILKEFLPAETEPHRVHKLGFSVISQLVFYKMHSRLTPMIVGESEVAEHFQPDAIAEHVTSVMLAALGSLSTAWEKSATPIK